MRNVGIIGAGPGGLAAGVLLQSKGFQVEVFESSSVVGGRNSGLKLGDFTFDVGPTFFLMPEVLREIATAAGKDLADYLDLRRVDPMYRLDFGDGSSLHASGDPFKMSAEIARFSSRDADRFWSFRDRQARKFEAVLPALRKPFSGFRDFLNPELVSAVPFLDTGTVYDELRDHFEDERVRLAFTFQAKYLGMSPFECPSLFTILPHIEHALGVWHPIGGCHQVSGALARMFRDLGGRIHLNSPVKRCLLKQRAVTGVELADGERRSFDEVIMNADFAYGMSELFPDLSRRKFKDAKLAKLKYSCSTFMMYLGIRGELPWDHHQIFFSQNYRKNIRELTVPQRVPPQEPSFYVHNPSALDPTLAPAGHSALYVLVPVANQDSGTDWDAIKADYRAHVLAKIHARTGIDLESRIVTEKIITPRDWERDYNVYRGATFSLSHSLDQMMQFRPHNASEEFDNLYIVGGGTHPGSGLPTILQSSIIAADLIASQRDRRRPSLPNFPRMGLNPFLRSKHVEPIVRT